MFLKLYAKFCSLESKYNIVLEEEVEESFLDPGPVSLCEIVHAIPVIDLQNVFEVLSPPIAAKVCSQPRRIPEGRPCLTSPLRLSYLHAGGGGGGGRLRLGIDPEGRLPS